MPFRVFLTVQTPDNSIWTTALEQSTAPTEAEIVAMFRRLLLGRTTAKATGLHDAALAHGQMITGQKAEAGE